jgi:hypothetical protein
MVIYSLVESNRNFGPLYGRANRLLTMDIFCLALNDGSTSAEHKPSSKSKQSVGDKATKRICMLFFIRHRDKDHQKGRNMTLDIHIILLSGQCSAIIASSFFIEIVLSPNLEVFSTGTLWAS